MATTYRPSSVILTNDTSVGLPITAAEPPAVIPSKREEQINVQNRGVYSKYYNKKYHNIK